MAGTRKTPKERKNRGGPRFRMIRGAGGVWHVHDAETLRTTGPFNFATAQYEAGKMNVLDRLGMAPR